MDPQTPKPSNEQPTPEDLRRIDDLCVGYEESLGSAAPEKIEDLLRALPENKSLRARALEELLLLEWDYCAGQLDPVQIAAYQHRFPDQADIVNQAFAAWEKKCGAREDSRVDGSTLDFAAHSRAEDLAEWIERYRQSQAAEPSLRPSEWLAKLADVPPALRTALRGMEFLSQLIPGASGQGTRIGDFKILREIGRGGMGVVFQAEQQSLGRIVALKVLWFAAVSDPEAIRRFQREASTVAKLHHTNIVPVFSVGNEGPINYYAMQFIEGQSLDRVAKARAAPIEWTAVAEWGLQAAEALEHAHQRGVIHRDVKPSNLLLDPDGRIWLTDFGLAKRNDDVTLSIAGALLGTPRYMSPEQASSSTRQVDHRSDVYSLGATLYELATGKPVFESSTPHGVISQILTAQPTPANQVARDIPRDFSTILMKCLAKDAEERYASARELANDLRALLEGRPIQAKRPNLIERGQQWVRRHRREFGWSVTSVAASAALLIIGSLSWYSWHRLREAQVSLTSPMSPIVAEILNRDGGQALGRQTVPTQDPLGISPGRYTMRVAAAGLLSQDFDIDLLPAERRKQSLNPDDQQLMPTIGNKFETTLVHSKSGAIVVTYDETLLTLTSQAFPNYGTLDIRFTDFVKTDTSPNFVWPPSKVIGGILDNADKFDVRPWISLDFQDWNGDGNEEMLIAMRHQALVALVGRDGLVRWSVGLAPDVMEAKPDSLQYDYQCSRSSVVEMPIPIADIDGDAAQDVLVQVAYINPWGSPNLKTAERKVVALSGNSGKVLWSYDALNELFDLPAGIIADYHFRWFTGVNTSSSGGGGSFFVNQGMWSRISTIHSSRTSEFVPVGTILRADERLRADEQQSSKCLFQAGPNLVTLDLATGMPLGKTTSMGHVPFQAPVVAEMDGKAGKELIFLEDLHGQIDPSVTPPGVLKYRMRVVVWSLTENRVLWKHELSAHDPFTRNWLIEKPKWPTIADLDGDGRDEVIVPDDTELGASVHEPVRQSSLKVLSSEQGKVLWKQRIRHADTQIERYAIGPDINRDQYRDVLVASMSGMPVRVHVDCLSGLDGSTLWTSHAAIESNESPESFYLDEPFLWENLADGWPQFVVRTISTQSMQNGTETFFFSTGTGQVLHRLIQANRFSTADVDNDGTEDLAITKYEMPDRGMVGKSTTRFVRGSAGMVWQRLGPPSKKVTDLDGDQLEDLIAIDHRSVTARSATTGQQIWQKTLDEFWSKVHVHSCADRVVPKSLGDKWDFDNDGTNDLLLEMESSGFLGSPVQALSGRTGRTLWKSSFQARYQQGRPRIECTDLDNDGVAEVIVYGFNDTLVEAKTLRSSYSGQDGNLMLIVLSSANGSVKWQEPLTREYGSVSNVNLPFQIVSQSYPELNFSDLNSDGNLDVIATAESPESTTGPYSTEVVAFDGRNGQALWKHARDVNTNANYAFSGSSRVAVPPSSGASRSNKIYLLNCEDVIGPEAKQQRFAKLTCYDSLQQRELWTQSIEVDMQFNRNSQDRKDYLHPCILQRRNGSSWIALRIVVGAKSKVVVIDEHGSVIGEKLLKGEHALNHQATPMLVADCDKDGNDEIITSNGGLDVMRVTNTIELMYHLPIYVDEWGATKFYCPPTQSDQDLQIVVEYDGANPRAVGFDARTGTRLWECQGPSRHRSFSDGGDSLNLLHGTGVDIPWVVFNNLDQVNCQIPSRIKPETTPTTKSRERLIAAYHNRLAASAYDPRLIRKLPWYASIDAARTSVEFPRLIKNGVLASLILAILPGWYIVRTIRRRVFHLNWWLLAPVIAAVWIVFLMSHVAELPVSKAQKIGFAIYLAPPVILVFKLTEAVFRRRWAPFGFHLSCIIVTSFILATASFIEAFSGNPLQSGERFSMQGWYWIVLYGHFVWSWIGITIAKPMTWIGAMWRRRQPKAR